MCANCGDPSPRYFCCPECEADYIAYIKGETVPTDDVES